MLEDIIEYITFTIDRLSYFELMFYMLSFSVAVGLVGGTIELIIKKLKGESIGDDSEQQKEEISSEASEESIEQHDWNEDDNSVSDNHYDNDSISADYYDDRSALERYLDEHEKSALERYMDREEAALEHYLDDEHIFESNDYDVFDDAPSTSAPYIPNSKNEGWYDNTDYEDPADMYDDDETF